MANKSQQIAKNLARIASDIRMAQSLESYNKVERIKNVLVGKQQNEIRSILGYWWVLSSQTDIGHIGFTYHFERVPQGDIIVETKHGIVTDVRGKWFPLGEQHNEYINKTA